jgi:hypothetical protein
VTGITKAKLHNCETVLDNSLTSLLPVTVRCDKRGCQPKLKGEKGVEERRAETGWPGGTDRAALAAFSKQ